MAERKNGEEIEKILTRMKAIIANKVEPVDLFDLCWEDGGACVCMCVDLKTEISCSSHHQFFYRSAL
jgi:hypothetical protein